jgi:anti-sigma factor RsiW
MKHEDDERLSAYVDGELDDLETARLERDLQQDPSLREALSAVRAARAWVQREGPVSAPPALFDKVMAEVNRDRQTSSQHAWWRRPFGVPLEGLALAAVVVLVFYGVLPSAPAPEPEPELTPAVRLESHVPEGLTPEVVAPPDLTAPEGWVVTMPANSKLDVLVNAAMSSRASFVGPNGEPLPGGPNYGTTYVRIAAANAVRLQRALEQSGATLTPIGEPQPVSGFVRLRLEVRAAR